MGRTRISGGLGATLLVLTGMLAACGGGGGESGPTAAAVSSVSSEGPIEAFGSVIMNGVRWNTDRAEFEVEGRSASQDDLSLGMVVRVEGTRFADGSATADRVIFESKLRGPIRRIDDLGPDTRALQIFGIRALVSRAETRFEGVDLDSLATDNVVELSGFTNGAGELEVTHLRERGRPIVGQTEVKLFGVVDGLAGGSFLVGTSEVQFDGSTLLDDFGAGGLDDGSEVRVEGILLANDFVRATEIESPRRARRGDFDENEIQGVVTDLVSLANFRVAGQRVDASGAGLFPNDPALLRNGVRVEVEGRLSAADVLIAEKLKFRSNRVRVHAEIASAADIDANANTLWLLGIPIRIDSLTRVRDQRDDLPGFGLDDVSAGDFLEIRGVARPDGTVVATRFEREQGDDLRLRGPVDMIDSASGMFTIMGVEIQTGSRTSFRDDRGRILSEAEFFSRIAAGMIAEARDRQDGDETDFDIADEVELEEPELEDRDDDDEDGDDAFDDSSDDSSSDDGDGSNDD